MSPVRRRLQHHPSALALATAAALLGLTAVALMAVSGETSRPGAVVAGADAAP